MSDTAYEAYFIAQGLQKIWGNITVAFSLAVHKNSMTAIMGPSGSGKSTVLNMIAGLVQSEGYYTLTLGGADIARLPPGKRGIGMVFQTPALFSHMRVDDNIAYGLKCRGVSTKESRKLASRWLERVGLAGFEKRFPETLSGGEAQRVSIARTLIIEPRLILFDEPLSALDAPLRKKLGEEISALSTAIGFTGILVTHDIDAARSLCTKVIHMKNGSIERVEEA
jgi:ABC-type Fe3+/spermidine/putrescine transport system ATPase subunit